MSEPSIYAAICIDYPLAAQEVSTEGHSANDKLEALPVETQESAGVRHGATLVPLKSSSMEREGKSFTSVSEIVQRTAVSPRTTELTFNS